MNQFVWACENYEITPYKQIIMKRLIEEEDTRSLQLITDYSANIHGENNTLIDLALTFIECDKLAQAKLILQVRTNFKLFFFFKMLHNLFDFLESAYKII